MPLYKGELPAARSLLCLCRTSQGTRNQTSRLLAWNRLAEIEKRANSCIDKNGISGVFLTHKIGISGIILHKNME